MARPKLQLCKEHIEDLAGIGCTNNEIATILETSDDTLTRRFADSLKKGRARMKESLRRFQYKAAADGNVTAMIWLGKQYLDQSDKRAVEMSGDINITQTWTDVLREISAENSQRPVEGTDARVEMESDEVRH